MKKLIARYLMWFLWPLVIMIGLTLMASVDGWKLTLQLAGLSLGLTTIIVGMIWLTLWCYVNRK